MQGSQEWLLRLLAWSSLAGISHGQAAWPWALRLSGENLLIDLGQARRLGLSLVVLGISVSAIVLAWIWRKPRWYLLANLPLLLILTPWPSAHVVLVPAYPTSFHRSPTGFSAQSIAQGQALYSQHCAGCHGTDGRGQTQIAASLPIWPPNLAGPLLWRRADGDLLWHVRHGMKDPQGTTTMPAFAQLSDEDAWALIDFMKAQGAGQSLRASGVWVRPVGVPDTQVRCEGREPRALSAWRGQRIRIVAASRGAAPLTEDPRILTVLLRPNRDDNAPQQAECIAESRDAWNAFALIAGTDQLAGTQLLADRDGWLRALGAPGSEGWSEDDLLCRSDAAPVASTTQPADGIGGLIARMDAEPVRFLKGGFVH